MTFDNDFAKLKNMITLFADKQFDHMAPKLRGAVVTQMFGPIGVALAKNDDNLTMESLQRFLNSLLDHKLDYAKLKNRKGFFYDDIVSSSVLNNPWFKELHDSFYTLKPGNSQAGPLEFLLCFLFSNTEYVQHADRGGDVIVDGKYRVEIKQHNSNKTIDHSKMDYYCNGGCDLLLVVKQRTGKYPPVMVGLDFQSSSEWSDIIDLRVISKKETKLYVLINHGELCKDRGLVKATYLAQKVN